MTNLRRIAFWAPVGFLILLEAVRTWLLAPAVGDLAAGLVFLAVAAIGVVLFSFWMFRMLAEAHRREQVALRQARSRSEELAVLKERERISMDLHDGTIQSLYALGLQLEAVAEAVPDGGPAKDMNRLIDTVGRIIGDIRHYIFDLKLTSDDRGPFRPEIEDLIDALQLSPRISTSWSWDHGVETALEGRPLRATLLQIFREALTNVVKHAEASAVFIGARRRGGHIVITIADDGIGFHPGHVPPGGRGLSNMRARAASINAHLEIGPLDGPPWASAELHTGSPQPKQIPPAPGGAGAGGSGSGSEDLPARFGMKDGHRKRGTLVRLIIPLEGTVAE